MTRYGRIRACVSEIQQEAENIAVSAAFDTPWGDETAKEHAAHVGLVLERIRKILEAPVRATERRQVSKTVSTIPASEAP